METWIVRVTGAITADGTGEYYSFTDLNAAALKFGKRIGEVFETHLREEGFIRKITATGVDMDDSSGEREEVFEMLLSAEGIEDNGHDSGTAVVFHNDRNDRIGAVVLLGWTS